MLRDSHNLYPQMQKRLLKRFIEKQVTKLRQQSEQHLAAGHSDEHATLLES